MKLALRRQQFDEAVGRHSAPRFRLAVRAALSSAEAAAVHRYGYPAAEVFFPASQVTASVPLEDVRPTAPVHLKRLRARNLLEPVVFVSRSSLPLRKLEEDIRRMMGEVHAFLVAETTYGGDEVLDVGFDFDFELEAPAEE